MATVVIARRSDLLDFLRRIARGGVLIFTLGLVSCASLPLRVVSSPHRADPRLAPLQLTVNLVAGMYNMPNPPTVVTDAGSCGTLFRSGCIGGLPSEAMAQYQAHYNEIVLRAILLEESMRGLTQVVLAHEVGHYLLGHKIRGWYSSATYAQYERDANAKGVEVLTRLGVPPDKALRAMYLLIRNGPCADTADLLRRYPQHPSDLTAPC